MPNYSPKPAANNTPPLTLSTLLPAVQGGSVARDTENSDAPYIGIDFGTSTTVASYVGTDSSGNPCRAEPIPIRQLQPDGRSIEHHIVPSAIAFIGGQVLVGQGAFQFSPQLRQGVDYWSSFKMQLGEDLGAQFYSSRLRGQDGLPSITRPRDAAAVFLRFIREGVESWLAKKGVTTQPKYAISIPASFEANQRADFLAALSEAGIHIEGQTFIDEPNAAFISYLEEARLSHTPLRVTLDGIRGLVFDYGAGTCDISVLDIRPDPKLGFASQNIAISKFANLGGDDVDYAIAERILLPQIIKASAKTLADFSHADLTKRIIPQLKPVAEELKVAICKRVATADTSSTLPVLAKAEECIIASQKIIIQLPHGEDLSLTEPSLSFSEFSSTCEGLLSPTPEASTDDIGIGGRQLLSIFEPIKSALTKASLTPEDLDFVLLVGGSSSNPYVQDALRKVFGQRRLLIPQDLRSHVSQGAALHSYLLHGRGLNVIIPITSESLLVATRGGSATVLLPAGTPITDAKAEIRDLTVAEEGQRVIEIPICVGVLDKVVANVRIESDGILGFSRGDIVQVNCRLSPDKVLTVGATVGNLQATAHVTSPYANAALTPRQREMKVAEKQANDSAAQNGGKPTADKLQNLAHARAKAGKHSEAAETFDLLGKVYPDKKNAFQTAFQYGCAGNKTKERAIYLDEFARQPRAVTAHNIAVGFSNEGNSIQARAWHEKAIDIDPNYPASQLALGLLLKRDDPSRSRKLIADAMETLEEQSRGLNQKDVWTWNALARAYEAVGRISDATAAKKRARSLDKDRDYNDENLLSSQAEGIVSK